MSKMNNMKTIFKNHFIAISPDNELILESICELEAFCKLYVEQYYNKSWKELDTKGWKVTEVNISITPTTVSQYSLSNIIDNLSTKFEQP